MIPHLTDPSVIENIARALRRPWKSRPRATKNWGWCSDSCYQKAEEAHKLQETELDVLTGDACKVMGKEDKANPHIEICTGRKRSYPTIETYEMLKQSGYVWFERKVSLNRDCIYILHYGLSE